MEKFAVGRRQAYYELFKACRLCGSGGGYKMPIVQTGLVSGDGEPELRHKIRDCCSIDVHLDDKMPPLVCELCVDKVNDFYEFREMCKATNSRVRVSLGLPPQNFNQEMSDDCILGVSGPLIYNSKELETSQHPVHKPIKLKVSLKDKKGPKILSSEPPLDRRSTKKEAIKVEPPSLLSERSTKRKRGSENASPSAVPAKRIRFLDSPKPSTSTKNSDKRTGEASKKSKETIVKKPIPTSSIFCEICKSTFTKAFSLKQHLITQHSPNIISEKYGCTPCREWFTTAKLADDHHKWHRTSSTFYSCDKCSTKFKVLHGYTRHFLLKQCIPEEVVPDELCSVCQKPFATMFLMDTHKCSGPPFSGNCKNCNKQFAKKASLIKHEAQCKRFPLSSPLVNPNNPHLKALKPIQITMPKCDNLLEIIKREPVDSSDVEPIYDISRLPEGHGFLIKSEPVEFGFNEGCDMDIKQEIKEEYPDYNFDSGGCAADDDYSSDESGADEVENSHTPNLVINPFARKNNTQVESLSFISLRSIFSNKMFKKKNLPKKRILKTEKSDSNTAFDSLFGTSSECNVGDHSIAAEHLESEPNLNVDKNIESSTNTHANINEIGHNDLTEQIDCQNIDNILEERTKNIDTNTSVLDRITITSVEGNSSLQFESDIVKANDTDKNIAVYHSSSTLNDCDGIVVDKDLSESVEILSSLDVPSQNNNKNSKVSVDGALVSAENIKEKPRNEDVVPDTLEENLLADDVKLNSNSVDLLQSNNSVDLLQSNNSDENISNMIGKSSIENNIDFDIDSVLQEDLNTSMMRESVLKLISRAENENHDSNAEKLSENIDTSEVTNSDSQISDQNNEKLSSENIKMNFENKENIDGEIISTSSDNMNMDCENYREKIQTPEDSNDEKMETSEDINHETQPNIYNNLEDSDHNVNKLTTSVITTNSFVKSLSHDTPIQDIVEKSESDILDLVSDSGDDCNIIDSPEKLKALEDQLLADDIDDVKTDDINLASSVISQNNGDSHVENFSEYDLLAEDKLENGTLLETDRENELLNSPINELAIEGNSDVLDKLNSHISYSNLLGTDSNTMEISNEAGIAKITNDVNINSLRNIETDKSSTS